MRATKRTSKLKSHKDVAPALGAVGILSLAGGMVGGAAAMCMRFVRFSTLSFLSFSEVVFRFTPTPGILLGALSFAMLMGLLGGLFPAAHAAKISPVAAMRD